MKKAIFYILSVFVLVGGITVSEASSQTLIRQIITRMNKHYESMDTLKANVERSMLNVQLGDPTNYEGKLLLIPSTEKKKVKGAEKKIALRLDWVKPRVETLSVVNGKYVLFVPGMNRAYFGDAKSNTSGKGGANALEALSMSEAELRANYEPPILLSENAKLKDGTGTFHLKLVPKVKNNFKFAELWVDTDGMPRQVRITANNNDTDTFYLSGVKKNETINTNEFKVEVGKAERVKQ